MGPIECKCNHVTFYSSRLKNSEREHISSKFWKILWFGKMRYVGRLTDINLTKRARDRKEESRSRRALSYKNFLKVNYENIRVCKSTFISTLGIGEWMVLNWLKEFKK